MEEKRVESWRDLTLLQLGALLKRSVFTKDQKPCQEWLDLKNSMSYAEAMLQKEEKAANKKWKGFQVNSTEVLRAYFFTYAAAVHRRFLYPKQPLFLDEIVRDYHLDFLVKDYRDESYDFTFYFSGIIPHRTVPVGEGGVVPACQPRDVNWIFRDNKECAKICWARMMDYMGKEDAPTFQTKSADAFDWLAKKNQGAHKAIRSETGLFLFNYHYECEMRKAYPRFLEQMDNWNPKFLKLWEMFLEEVNNTMRELSAVRDITSVTIGELPPVSGRVSASSDE